jgi:hypothetical protein
MGFCGFLAVGRSGANCRRSILRSRPAIAAFSSGFAREVGRSTPFAGASALRTGQAEPRRSVRRCHLREREKGGFAVGPTRRGKGTKIVAVAADNSLPLAVSVQSASPAECQLVEEVLAGSFLDELPARLIGDKAYDSDKLDQKLRTVATGAKLRTGASSAATRNVGRSKGSSPGCTTFAASSPDGSTTSKTSSDLSTSPACT